MENVKKGKSWKFGNNVDTDVIIPARYLNTMDPNELAKHCMEDIDKDFTSKISSGDIIVAGENFGCGSSREHAPIAIKAAGISVVIAKSFARIFYRNAINIGLPIMEVQDLPDKTDESDEIEVDLSTGLIRNLTQNKTYQAKPFPEAIQQIINSGGLVEYTAKKVLNAHSLD